MQLVTWSEWLDRHIPYYTRNKQIARYADNIPTCVLIVSPVDRNLKATHGSFTWTRWDEMDNRIQNLGYKAEPVFLDTDTHQRWYWVFWNEQHALMALLKLT